MTKIFCCICSRRTDKSNERRKLGCDSIWTMFEIYARNVGLEMSKFSKVDYICLKCDSTISHYRMTDRGTNKKIKIYTPVSFEPSINKTVLRNVASPVIDTHATSDTGTTESSTDEFCCSIIEHFPYTMTANNDASSATTSAAIVQDFDFSICDYSIGQQYSKLTLEGIENGNSKNAKLNMIDSSFGTYIHESSESPIETVGNNESMDDGVASESIVDENQIGESITNESGIYKSASDVSGMIESVVNDENTMIYAVENINPPSSAEVTCEPSDSNSILTFTYTSGTLSTQSKCFVCESTSGRSVVPWEAIQQVWFDKKIYIPKSNRTCQEHLNERKTFKDEALQKIVATKQGIRLKTSDFELWLHEVSKLAKPKLYNFDDDGIEASMYPMFLGIGKDDFDDLVTHLHGMRNTETRSIRNALAMFLLLLRNNMKQEIIAFNFSTTQQVVSKTIDSVSAALEEHFVPLHLGYHHITRDEALERHSIKLTSNVLGLLGQSEARLYVIADCTYNYIEKPSDFVLQRMTFSAHKKRNLIKPLYIVLPDGYILEAAGPYFCDQKNNDAANIRHHYKTSDIMLFLEEDDCFIFDRGFRDVVAETTENGKAVVMPSLLTGKRTQFTCEEANESRKVTMNRWVVEAVNARVKNIFPFFKHMIEGTYVPKIMRFNRIACSIINKYFRPLFTDKEFHTVISKVTKEGYVNSNELKQEIDQLGFQRMTTRWQKASEDTVPDFPKLTMEDLRRITLGSYQIAISEKYVEQHLREDSKFGIFIHRDNDKIIRARIQSRFSKSKSHNTWVKFDRIRTGFEAIAGYYCSCKVGERTLGCCSHVTTVLRYLGYDRHQPPKLSTRSRATWDVIDCSEEVNEDSDEYEDIDD